MNKIPQCKYCKKQIHEDWIDWSNNDKDISCMGCANSEILYPTPKKFIKRMIGRWSKYFNTPVEKINHEWMNGPILTGIGDE